MDSLPEIDLWGINAYRGIRSSADFAKPTRGGYLGLLASLLGAWTLLGAPSLTRSKDATRSKGHRTLFAIPPLVLSVVGHALDLAGVRARVQTCDGNQECTRNRPGDYTRNTEPQHPMETAKKDPKWPRDAHRGRKTKVRIWSNIEKQQAPQTL